MFESGRSAAEIVAAEGLGAQVADDAIEKAARDMIAKNPDNVAKFKSGNEGVFKFFVGQVMKATKGQANPQSVNDIVRRFSLKSCSGPPSPCPRRCRRASVKRQCAFHCPRQPRTQFQENVPMLKIGQKAPEFTLTSDTGKQLSLKDFKGRRVLLFFYPKANTPG